jgi:hypothetical protein
LFDNLLSGNSISSSNSTAFRDNLDNQFNPNIKDSSHLADTINSTNEYNNYYDEVMKVMQAQIPKSDTLNGKNIGEITDEDWNILPTPTHWKTIRKLRKLEINSYLKRILAMKSLLL